MINSDLDLVLALLYTGEAVLAGRRSGLHRLANGDWEPAYASLEVNEGLTTAAIAAVESLVFTGTIGGILRSEDSGEHWQAFELPPPASMVNSIVLSPDFNREPILLAGTTEDGLYRSADAGLNWSPSNIGLYDRRVLCMAWTGATILVGTDSGLYRSYNTGRSWQAVPFAQEPASILSLCATQSGVIFAGTEAQGLYSSIDNGRSWIQAGESTFEGAVNALQADNAHVLALVNNRLWISRDGGVTFQAALSDAGVTAFARVDEHTVYAGYEDGSVTRHTL